MTYHVFRDGKREWRWCLRARNGRIVACSGEGYKRKRDRLHGLALTAHSADVAITVVP